MLNSVEIKMFEPRGVLSRFVKISQKINVQSNLGFVFIDNAFHFKLPQAMATVLMGSFKKLKRMVAVDVTNCKGRRMNTCACFKDHLALSVKGYDFANLF